MRRWASISGRSKLLAGRADFRHERLFAAVRLLFEWIIGTTDGAVAVSAGRNAAAVELGNVGKFVTEYSVALGIAGQCEAAVEVDVVAEVNASACTPAAARSTSAPEWMRTSLSGCPRATSKAWRWSVERGSPWS